jgi:hypothetical protein
MASKGKKEPKPSETEQALKGRTEVNDLKARFAKEAQTIVHEIMPQKVIKTNRSCRPISRHSEWRGMRDLPQI